MAKDNTNFAPCPKCKKGTLLMFKEPNIRLFENGLGYTYRKSIGELIFYKCSVCKHVVR